MSKYPFKVYPRKQSSRIFKNQFGGLSGRLSVRPSVTLFLQFCLVNIFHTNKHCSLLLHTQFAYMYDLKVCHDFNPRSFGQVRGHWKEKSKIGARSLSFLCRRIGSSYRSQIQWNSFLNTIRDMAKSQL